MGEKIVWAVTTHEKTKPTFTPRQPPIRVADAVLAAIFPFAVSLRLLKVVVGRNLAATARNIQNTLGFVVVAVSSAMRLGLDYIRCLAGTANARLKTGKTAFISCLFRAARYNFKCHIRRDTQVAEGAGLLNL